MNTRQWKQLEKELSAVQGTRTEKEITLELFCKYKTLQKTIARLKMHRNILASALAKIAHQQSITGRQAQHLATTALNRISAVKPAKSAGT